jgi:hypothetical protein
MKIELPPKQNPNFTKEESQKGGKNQTVWRTLSQSLGRRQKCSPTCFYFEQCPVAALSLGYENPAKPEENKKCMMKEFPLNVRQQFINMFLTGEEGVIRAIKEALYMYQMEVETRGTLRDKRDLIDIMLRIYSEVYVKPKGFKSAQLSEPLTIVIRRVGKEPEVIDVTPNQMLPEGVKIRDILESGNVIMPEDDAESLFNSPRLKEITRHDIE